MTDLGEHGSGRRSFLKALAATGATSLLGFEALACSNGQQGAPASTTATSTSTSAAPVCATGGYGPLRPTRDQTTGEALLALPAGFEYLTFARTGELMSDGRPSPSRPDGMGAFRVGELVHLVRNHEIGEGPAFAPGMTYDDAAGGGTTTLVFDPDDGALVRWEASLAGTLRSCAGGATPWGTWLSCEETTVILGSRRHGYVFEVPADGRSDAVPLTAMGRFSHEAAAVDPGTGIVYLTEDALTSGLYRFVPTSRGDLRAGGRLQMLAIGDAATATRADAAPVDYGTVTWVDIDEPDPAPGAPSTVQQGVAKGGATFERGEGIVHGNDRLYVVSTSGGPARGQVFELDPATDRLRLVFHSRGPDILDAPDNLCVSPRGGLLLCEDGSRPQQRLQGLTADGEVFPFAVNLLNGSEWAGACFEPEHGRWLFANLQTPGITVAITGPWECGAL